MSGLKDLRFSASRRLRRVLRVAQGRSSGDVIVSAYAASGALAGRMVAYATAPAFECRIAEGGSGPVFWLARAAFDVTDAEASRIVAELAEVRDERRRQA